MTENIAAATCTVNAAEFTEALRDLVRTAGDDPTLPMINGVLLHTDTFNGKTVLVGTSTDRFRLGQAHVECTGSIAQTLVPLANCKRLLAVLKLYAKVEDTTLLELMAQDDNLLMRFGSVLLPFARIESHEQFPKLRNIFGATAVTPERTSGVNPKFLGIFASIAEQRHDRLHLTMQGEMKPILISIGEHYRGLLMPVREEAVVLPWFVPAKEQADIAAAATAQAEAEAVTAKTVADAEAREQRNARRRAARASAKTEQPAKKTAAKKPAAKRATRTKAAA